jgi:hypothetical protein
MKKRIKKIFIKPTKSNLKQAKNSRLNLKKKNNKTKFLISIRCKLALGWMLLTPRTNTLTCSHFSFAYMHTQRKVALVISIRASKREREIIVARGGRASGRMNLAPACLHLLRGSQHDNNVPTPRACIHTAAVAAAAVLRSLEVMSKSSCANFAACWINLVAI